MTSGERRLLEQVRQEHARAFVENVTGVEDRILAAVGISRTETRPVSASGLWQDEAERLFVEARNGETMLVALLGTSPDQINSPELPAKTAASLAQLRSRAESYQHLTDR